MQAELTLPDTSIGRDTEVEVAMGLLTGLSLEFQAAKDTVDEERQHRTIERGTMFGFGVVDDPAYPGSRSAESDGLTTLARWVTNGLQS